MRSARALTAGLIGAGVLAGALLVGPVPIGAFTARAHPPQRIATFEEPPPSPDPGPPPDTQGPANPGPRQAAPPQHRRHIDNDPIFRK